MHYFNMTGTAEAMPKFVFYSAHAESIAPITRAFDYWELLDPSPAFMAFVNFYEVACADNADETCYQVEGSYVPHWRLEKEEIEGFEFSID